MKVKVPQSPSSGWHQLNFYAMGLIGSLLCCPVLFLSRDSDSRHNDESKLAISSHHFAYSVVAILGYTVPLALEVVSCFCEKQSFSFGTYNPIFSRAMICVTLLTTSVLNLYFSMHAENVHATWAILNMRFVLFTSIVFHQMLLRFSHTMSAPWWYAAGALWILVAVFRAHTVDLNVKSALSVVITILIVPSFVVVLISQVWHIKLHFQREIDNIIENDMWKSCGVPSMILIFLCLWALYTVVSITAGDIYSCSAVLWVGFNYSTASGLGFFSMVIGHELTLEHAMSKGKLMVKRQFVRYASHEIRTPLNSCVLGLRYLHSLMAETWKNKEPSAAYDGSKIYNNGDGGPESIGLSCAAEMNENIASINSVIEEMKTVLAEVDDSCGIAMEFVNNLLLYEKIDSMDLPLFLKTEDLVDVCSSAVKSFSLSAKQLNIDLNLAVKCTERPDSISINNSDTGQSSQSECVDNAVQHRLNCSSKNASLVTVDSHKIMVVFRNLVSNALKFTPEGGQVMVTITPIDLSDSSRKKIINMDNTDSACSSDRYCLSVFPPAAKPEATTHYRVCVSDTGPGLSKSEINQLFGSFVQISPNEMQQGAGSGIGLFLSQKIAQGHGTQVHVHSEGILGKGTHFYIDFPAVLPTPTNCSTNNASSKSSIDEKLSLLSHDGMATTATSSSRGGQYLTEPGRNDDYNNSQNANADDAVELVNHDGDVRNRSKNIRVLVVDDSAMNRKMLKRTLIQQGIGKTVDEAVDGLDLLDAIGISPPLPLVRHAGSVAPESPEMEKYDLLLVDNNMPRMSGGEAVSLLRKNGYSGLVVGLTGNAMQEDLNAFCEAGADYALPKPLEIELLTGILNAHAGACV